MDRQRKGEKEMAKVYSFFADGFEEVEALTPVDLLRRTGNDVVTVSIMGRKQIHGSHGILIEADTCFEDLDFDDGDLFILPGGGEGTQNLAKFQPLTELLKKVYGEGKRVAAICAAPSVFGTLGFVNGKKATVYPGMEGTLTGAEAVDQPVVTDGNVTTGHGPGAAFDFALELVKLMNGEQTAKKLKEQTVFQHHSVV
jgi:4-methyl-5(b-hydroxyethyl)-thiazole monophosphate biosynthesis